MLPSISTAGAGRQASPIRRRPLIDWLKRFSFPALIDIGANDGALGQALNTRFAFPVIHAFEPNPVHVDSLVAKGCQVHQVALGDQPGEADLLVTGYDAASSLFPITDFLQQQFPQVSFSHRERVRVARLDDEMAPIPGAMAKIDAQGAEQSIIRGGPKVLGAAKVVLIEMTFAPLYEGGSLFEEVHDELVAIGFKMAGFDRQSTEPDGKPMFAHCFYLKG